MAFQILPATWALDSLHKSRRGRHDFSDAPSRFSFDGLLKMGACNLDGQICWAKLPVLFAMWGEKQTFC